VRRRLYAQRHAHIAAESMTAASMTVEQDLGTHGKIVSSQVESLIIRSQTSCKQHVAMDFEDNL